MLRRFCVLLGGLVVFLGCLRSVVDFDVWFDLRMGDAIRASGVVPHISSWIWPADHLAMPWFANDEWGFSVLASLMYRALGVTGLSFLTALPATLCLALGAATARRRGVGWLPVALVVALGVAALQGRLMPRPQLWTDMLLAAFVLVAEPVVGSRRRSEDDEPGDEVRSTDERAAQADLKGTSSSADEGEPRERPWQRFWLFPALMAVWCNLHSGCFVGVAYLGLVLTGVAMTEWLSARRREASPGGSAPSAPWTRSRCAPLAIALGASLAVTGLCPAGYGLLAYFVDTLFVRNFHTQVIEEWQPLTMHATAVMAYLGVALAALIALAWRRRLRPQDVLVTVAFGGLAIWHARGAGELVATTLPILAAGLAAMMPGSVGWRRDPHSAQQSVAPGRIPGRLQPGGMTSALLAAGLACLFAWTAAERLPVAPVRGLYPEGAVRFLQAHHVPPQIFNSYHFGGYMVWRAGPDHRPFIHGMIPTYPDRLLLDYYAISCGGAPARQALDRWQVQAMVVGYGFAPGDVTATLLAWLERDPNWKLVYWDDAALVYVRRTAAFAGLPAYKAVRPGDPASWNPRHPRILGELRRAVAEAPSVRACCWLGDAVLASGGSLAPGGANAPSPSGGLGSAAAVQARRLYEQAADLDPTHFMPYARLGRLLASGGDLEGAFAALRRAWDCSPDAGQAYNLAVVEVRRGHAQAALNWARQALRVDPGFAPARALCEQLRG